MEREIEREIEREREREREKDKEIVWEREGKEKRKREIYFCIKRIADSYDSCGRGRISDE